MKLTEDGRERLVEFALAASANAFGTLIAALTLFVGGGIIGAITEVSTEAWITASSALVASLGIMATLLLQRRTLAESRRQQAAELVREMDEPTLALFLAWSRREPLDEDQVEDLATGVMHARERLKSRRGT